MLELEPDLTNLMYSGATEATKGGFSNPVVWLAVVVVTESDWSLEKP